VKKAARERLRRSLAGADGILNICYKLRAAYSKSLIYKLERLFPVFYFIEGVEGMDDVLNVVKVVYYTEIETIFDIMNQFVSNKSNFLNLFVGISVNNTCSIENLLSAIEGLYSSR
jgi:hypothetical protein